jgi:hypothetical protein
MAPLAGRAVAEGRTGCLGDSGAERYAALVTEPVGRLNRRPTIAAWRRQAKSARATKAHVAVRSGSTGRTGHYPLLKILPAFGVARGCKPV